MGYVRIKPSPGGNGRLAAGRAGPGFTLAEILVVLVLMGLVLSVILPRIGDVDQTERLKTAARRLAGQAAESYSQAATKSRPWFFCLDLDKNQTWLATVRPGEEGDAGRETPYYKLPGDIKLKDVIHPVDGMIKEGRISFGYWPQGGNEPGVVHLAAADGEEMTIFLRPFLGRTEIKDGYLREEAK
ncbi:MAG: prepilin-type N-terminal cleavage/methylation domain-containing protein [Pseudomonadota bacterium]